MTLEDQQRAAVVAEALSWRRTPYHHQGFIKGEQGGVDCAFLLAKVYHACGLIPEIDPRPYPPDWHFHKDAERYLSWVAEYAHPVAVPLPGDVALYKFGRCISHGAIVVAWPKIIHAVIGEGCTEGEGDQGKLIKAFAGYWSLWGRP